MEKPFDSPVFVFCGHKDPGLLKPLYMRDLKYLIYNMKFVKKLFLGSELIQNEMKAKITLSVFKNLPKIGELSNLNKIFIN